MSEYYPEPNELDRYEVGGRSLKEWHFYLTTGPDGLYDGDSLIPASRYATTGEQAAWWCLAFQCAYVDAHGEVEDPEASFEEAMSWVVNDNGDVADLVAEFWHAVPESVKQHIGEEDDVRRLDY